MNSLDNIVLGGDYLNLPTFIGNYLLDLVSLFFPLLLVVVLFVMGLQYFRGVSSKNFDWKSGFNEVLPTTFSIFIVLGILSMKEPIKTNNEFFKDTNSYVVVEMITMSIGLGSIFADALAHKMIYGNLDVNSNSGNANFNGFFPNALDEALNKDKEEKTLENTLVNIAKRGDVIHKINLNNNQVAINIMNDVLIPLYNTGVIRNHYGNFNSLEDKEKYNSFALGCDERCYIFQKINYAPQMNSYTNVTLKDVKGKDVDEFKIENSYSAIQRESSDDILKIDLSNIVASGKVEENSENYHLDLNSVWDSFYTKDYSIPSIKSNLGLLKGGNLDLEIKIVNVVRALLNNYIDVFNEYKIIIEDLENEKRKLGKDKKVKESERKAQIKVIDEEIKKYQSHLSSILLQQIKEVALFYKDVLKLFDNFGKNIFYSDKILNIMKDESLINKLNEIMGEDFFNGLMKSKNFSEEDFKELNNNYDLLTRKSIIFKYTFTGAENDRKNGEMLLGVLNAKYNAKKRNVLILYSGMKRILEADTLFQKALGFDVITPYSLTFLSPNSFKMLQAIANEKEKLKEEYTINGKVNITSILNKKINDLNPNLQNEVINWQDLGKNWATFKNAYQPIFNQMQIIDKMKSLNDLENVEMLKAMQEAEPKGVGNSVLNGLGAYAIGKGAMLGLSQIPIVSKAISFVKGSKKNDSSMVDNVIQKLGGGEKSKGQGFLSTIFDIVGAFGLVYGLMFLVSIVIPSVLWLFVNLAYYVEVAIYIAILPIGFIFLIFQSYNQGYSKFFYMLLAFILFPTILTSIFFVTLYMDMLVPIFLKEFLPFASSSQTLASSINIAMGGNDGIINNGVVGTINLIGSVSGFFGEDIMSYVGYFIYTIMGFITSIYLMLNWFRANEYMHKIIGIAIISNESFNNKETLSKFSSMGTYTNISGLGKI